MPSRHRNDREIGRHGSCGPELSGHLLSAASAAGMKDRQRSVGILRDCTPGAAREVAMIQSDPHGDMGSPAEMTGPVSSRNEFHVKCVVTIMPKVAKFLVG